MIDRAGNLEVYEIGTWVTLAEEIPAIITSINLRGLEHRVSYECTWWDGRTRKSEWFDPLELTAREAKRRMLKFIPSQDHQDANPARERLMVTRPVLDGLMNQGRGNQDLSKSLHQQMSEEVE